jgi:hypothetical protein
LVPEKKLAFFWFPKKPLLVPEKKAFFLFPKKPLLFPEKNFVGYRNFIGSPKNAFSRFQR